MKYLSFLLLLIVLLGAGCLNFGNSGGPKASDGGVLKTTDAGTTWVQAAAVPTSQGMGTLATSNVLNMELDPSDPLYVYAGTRESGFVYSEDGAISWRLPRQLALREGLVFNVQVDPDDVCTVYVAKANRLYKSTDCLHTFDDETYVDTRAEVLVEQIAVDWYNKGSVWIGLSNGDVLKSMDGGDSWKTVLKMRAEVSQIFLSQKDSREVLVASYTGGMQRTVDGGDTWEKVKSEGKNLVGFDQVYALSQTHNAGVVIAATKDGLLRSTDFGTTWEPVALLTSPGQVLIRAVAIVADDPNTIYYATTGTFYRTSDGGQTWQTQKLPSSRIPRALLIDPSDPKVLYVGVAESN